MDALSYTEAEPKSPAKSAANPDISCKRRGGPRLSVKAYNELNTALHVVRVMEKMDALGAVFEAIEGHPGWFKALCPHEIGGEPVRYACSVNEPYDLFDKLFAVAIRERLSA
jgi:hypothetical protein